MTNPSQTIASTGALPNNAAVEAPGARATGDVVMEDNFTGILTVVVQANANVTLPPKPAVNQRVLVVTPGAGSATVQGTGAFPLVGGPLVVAPGKAGEFIFTTEKNWVPVCCATPQIR